MSTLPLEIWRALAWAGLDSRGEFIAGSSLTVVDSHQASGVRFVLAVERDYVDAVLGFSDGAPPDAAGEIPFVELAGLIRGTGIARIHFLVAMSPAETIPVWRHFDDIDLVHVDATQAWLERMLGEPAPNPHEARWGAH